MLAMYYLVYTCFIFATILVVESKNLIENGDFEGDFSGNWFCNTCKLTKSTDAYKGKYSGQVTERLSTSAGVTQYVDVLPGKKYFFQAMVKMVGQQEASLWHVTTAMIRLAHDQMDEYILISRLPMHNENQGWTTIAGDIDLRNKEFSSARIYIQIDNAKVNYLIDDATLVELVPNENWKEDAQQRIESIRKSNVTFRISLDPMLDPKYLEIKVNMKKSGFAFGCAVQAGRLAKTDDLNRKYRDYFYDHFEWTTIETHLKWHKMEQKWGIIDMAYAERALDDLQAHGMPVRGHTVFWGKEQFVPEWLKPLSKDQVLKEMRKHAECTLARSRDSTIVQWDINNEVLYGTWYEEKLENPNVTADMFHMVHEYNPDVGLFLNDYDIVARGVHTAAYVTQAKTLMDSGVPVHGMGLQSHLRHIPDPELTMARLDSAASAGLPLWITELDVQLENLDDRAEAHERALTLYFSHPAVEGIILWGFWTESGTNEHAGLVDGENFVANKAGEKVFQLLHSDWRTNESLHPTKYQEDITISAFHGIYNVTVIYANQILDVEEFELTNTDQPIIDIVV